MASSGHLAPFRLISGGAFAIRPPHKFIDVTPALHGEGYVAITTDGKGVFATGTKIPIPNQKMKWDEGNPTGHGIIFIGTQGQVFCYVTPGGI